MNLLYIHIYQLQKILNQIHDLFGHRFGNFSCAICHFHLIISWKLNFQNKERRHSKHTPNLTGRHFQATSGPAQAATRSHIIPKTLKPISSSLSPFLSGPRGDLQRCRRRHAEALPACGNHPLPRCLPLSKELSLLSAEHLRRCSSCALGQEEGGECGEVHHEDQGGQLPASQPCNLQVCFHHPISSVYYR